MSILPAAPATIRSAPFGDDAPPGAALVLAGLDIASAAWLVCILVGVARATGEDAGMDGATPHMDFWGGLAGITLPVALLLVAISVSSLITGPARSQPRIFRALLAGTVTLSLVTAVFFSLA